MKRFYYSESVATFLAKSKDEILGTLVANNQYPLEMTQRDAWVAQIDLLKTVLAPYGDCGHIYFEFSIPRLGRRIDVLVIIRGVIFVLEFKVNKSDFTSSAIDQVIDYALDLKNFHETSHELPIAPVLIATAASMSAYSFDVTTYHDKTLVPIKTSGLGLAAVVAKVLSDVTGTSIESTKWEAGRYCPTPTIIEAATSLYSGHSVAEISRSDASAVNLTLTSDALSNIISGAKTNSRKAICFVTGVPGAGNRSPCW